MSSARAKPPSDIALRSAFGLAIKESRDSKHYSQEDLAGLSELSVSYISMLERGQRNLTMKSASQLSAALNLSLTDFVSIGESNLKSHSSKK